jgi:enamine deaminase RidA (YjgF/YER057c/UK114 family)
MPDVSNQEQFPGASMKKQLLNPKELYDPRFFTHAVAVEDAKLVYVSGQVSYDRDGIVLGQRDMKAQCEQVFKSITHSLRAAGATWSDVIKINGYMVRMNHEAVNTYREVRSRHLDAKQMPASTLVGVDRLVHDDLLIEVEVVAAVARKQAKARPAAKAKRKR